MRFRLLCVGLGAAFLLLSGFRPRTLPYILPAGYSDAAISHFPAALFLRQSVLEHGEFPLWRDTILGGQPFAANPLNKTAYPLQWLALLLPAEIHLDVMALLHLLIAGWGMERWARSLGLRAEAAALSGLAFALAPRMIAHLGAGHLDVVYALAWWPALMWAVHEAVTRPQNRLSALLRVSLLAGLVFLADVRVSLFALTLAAAYGAYEAIRERRLWARLWLAGAVVPFLLLIVPVMLPLLAWQPYLTRGDLTASGAELYSLELWQLGGLFGLPLHSGSHELLTYVGLPVLILVIIAVVSAPRRHAFFVAAVVVAALYALGNHGFLWSSLVRLIPPLVWFRVPSRAWLVIALIAPLLAGYGVEAIRAWVEARHIPARVSRARLLAYALLIASLVCAGLFFSLRLPHDFGLKTGITFVVGGGLTALVLLAAIRGRLRGRRLALALLMLTFVDLGWSGVNWLTWQGREIWLAPYADLAARLAQEQPARIYAPIYFDANKVTTSLPQEVAAVYGLRLFGGVDPFQLRGPANAIIAASGMPDSGYDVTLPYLPAPSAGEPAIVPDIRLLAEWDVSHVVSAFPIDSPRLQAEDVVDGMTIYRNLDFVPHARIFPDWPADAAQVPDAATMDRLNRLTLASAAVGGMSFVTIVAALIALRLRRRASASAGDDAAKAAAQ